MNYLVISMKLMRNDIWLLLMTWLYFGGQRSRSHIDPSMWWWRHLCRHWSVEVFIKSDDDTGKW